jgi:hypothetical protein
MLFQNKRNQKSNKNPIMGMSPAEIPDNLLSEFKIYGHTYGTNSIEHIFGNTILQKIISNTLARVTYQIWFFLLFSFPFCCCTVNT